MRITINKFRILGQEEARKFEYVDERELSEEPGYRFYGFDDVCQELWEEVNPGTVTISDQGIRREVYPFEVEFINTYDTFWQTNSFMKEEEEEIKEYLDKTFSEKGVELKGGILYPLSSSQVAFLKKYMEEYPVSYREGYEGHFVKDAEEDEVFTLMLI